MVRRPILPNVSFMYRIDATRSTDPKKDEMRVTRFEPLEISVVTVPADHSVGIGRAYAIEETEVRITADRGRTGAAVRANSTGATRQRSYHVRSDKRTAAAPVVTESELQAKTPIAYEQARKQAIINLVRANKLDERIGNAWITQGASMEQVSKDILPS